MWLINKCQQTCRAITNIIHGRQILYMGLVAGTFGFVWYWSKSQSLPTLTNYNDPDETACGWGYSTISKKLAELCQYGFNGGFKLVVNLVRSGKLDPNAPTFPNLTFEQLDSVCHSIYASTNDTESDKACSWGATLGATAADVAVAADAKIQMVYASAIQLTYAACGALALGSALCLQSTKRGPQQLVMENDEPGGTGDRELFQVDDGHALDPNWASPPTPTLA